MLISLNIFKFIEKYLLIQEVLLKASAIKMIKQQGNPKEIVISLTEFKRTVNYDYISVPIFMTRLVGLLLMVLMTRYTLFS